MTTNGNRQRGSRSRYGPCHWHGLLQALLVSAVLVPLSAAAGEVSRQQPRPSLEEGYALLDAGRLPEAESHFLQVLAADPGSIEANEGLMWIYHDTGDNALAFRHAEAMRDLAPDDMDVLRKWMIMNEGLMWNYHDSADTVKAFQHAEAMRDLTPDDMEVLKKWLVVAVTVADKESAVRAAAHRLARSYRDDANRLADLAGLLSVSDSYLAEAIDLYHEVISLDPQGSVYRNKLAHLLFRTGRFGEAEVEYRQVLDIAPADTTAKQGIAEIALQTGDHMSAIQLFEQQLADDPDNVDSLIGLARQAKFDGDLVTALELLERAERMHPDNSNIRAELDEIREDAERLKKARYGPTLPIVFAVTVLPLLYGSYVRRVSSRSYYLVAVCAIVVTAAALAWLLLVPLD